MNFTESRMVRGCWENDHPGQGLPASFDIHASAEPVPAVTGACLMIERALFDKLGGMSEEYVIGDFEDSDLCLRAREQGLKVYYTPEVELYHLERQSMRLIGDGNVLWRQSLTLYNMWKHTRRWGAMIPKVLNGSDRLGIPGIASDPLGRRDQTVKTRLAVIPGDDRMEGDGGRSNSLPIDLRKTNHRPARDEKGPQRGKR